MPFLDTGELIALEMLYRLAACGAEATGKDDLAAALHHYAAGMYRHRSQRGALATGEVADNA